MYAETLLKYNTQPFRKYYHPLISSRTPAIVRVYPNQTISFYLFQLLKIIKHEYDNKVLVSITSKGNEIIYKPNSTPMNEHQEMARKFALKHPDAQVINVQLIEKMLSNLSSQKIESNDSQSKLEF